ncbi:hypothetical protein V8C35DRAFT_204940 [Trichoderma chlorosporum]
MALVSPCPGTRRRGRRKRRRAGARLQRRAGINPTRPRDIPSGLWCRGGVGRGGDSGPQTMAMCQLRSKIWQHGISEPSEDEMLESMTQTVSRTMAQDCNHGSSRTPATAPESRARDLISSITRHCHDVASWQPSSAGCDKLCVELELEQQIWQPERRAGMTSRKRPVLARPRGSKGGEKSPIGRALPSPCRRDRCVLWLLRCDSILGNFPRPLSCSSASLFPRPPFSFVWGVMRRAVAG